MLKRLMDKKYNQMRVAFWILRMKNRQKRQINEMLIIQNALDRLNGNKKDCYRKFIDKFRNND